MTSFDHLQILDGLTTHGVPLGSFGTMHLRDARGTSLDTRNFNDIRYFRNLWKRRAGVIPAVLPAQIFPLRCKNF